MDDQRKMCPPPISNPLCGLPIRSDPKMEAQGWTRRHVADPARAKESVELYESLGYEVKAQELTPSDFNPACRECASAMCRSYVVIYTRKAPAASDPQSPEGR